MSKTFKPLKDGTILKSDGTPYPQYKDRAGYWRVTVWEGGKSRSHLVHRLVAEAHVPNPSGFVEVNHIDGNKANASSDNLEWCSRSRNMKHAYDTGLLAPVGLKLGDEDLLAIRQRYVSRCKVNGGRALAEEYGVSQSLISQIVNMTGKGRLKNV